jgi:hypothetical protein
MIRKLASGKYRLYSRKKDPKIGWRRNLGTFSSGAVAEKHERAVQYFKRHWSTIALPELWLLRHRVKNIVVHRLARRCDESTSRHE